VKIDTIETVLVLGHFAAVLITLYQYHLAIADIIRIVPGFHLL
jgi:hypothetical protein